ATPYLIGGSLPADRNIISGNGDDSDGAGIYINDSLFDANEMTIENNYIGTDISGTAIIFNTYNGIFVGGDTAHVLIRDNLISGNGSNSNNWGWGISVWGDITDLGGGECDLGADADPHDIMMIRNKIGTDSTGVSPVGNISTGVSARYLDLFNNGEVYSPIAIGIWYGADGVWGTGDDVVSGNLVSGNGGGEGGQGIRLVDVWAKDDTVAPAHEILIENNIIGLNAAGNAALMNDDAGIEIDNQCMENRGAGKDIGASGFDIGQYSPNVISGNDNPGIDISQSEHYRIDGNIIGTDVTRTLNLGNGEMGISMMQDQGGPNLIQNNYIANNNEGGIITVLNYDPLSAPGAGGTIQNNDVIGNGDFGVVAAIATYTISGNTIDGNTGPGLFVIGNTTEDPDNTPAIGPDLPVISNNTIINNADAGLYLVDAVTVNYGPLAGQGHGLWCANTDDFYDPSCGDLGDTSRIEGNNGGGYQYTQGWFGAVETLFNSAGYPTFDDTTVDDIRIRDNLGTEYALTEFSASTANPLNGAWGTTGPLAAFFEMTNFTYNFIYTWPFIPDFSYSTGGAITNHNPYTIEASTDCGTYTGAHTFQYSWDADGSNDAALSPLPSPFSDLRIPMSVAGGVTDQFQVAQILVPPCGGGGGGGNAPVSQCTAIPKPVDLILNGNGKLDVISVNGKPAVELNWDKVKMEDLSADDKIRIFFDYLEKKPEAEMGKGGRKLLSIFAKQLYSKVGLNNAFLPALEKAIGNNPAAADALFAKIGIKKTYSDWWPYLAFYFAQSNKDLSAVVSKTFHEMSTLQNEEGVLRKTVESLKKGNELKTFFSRAAVQNAKACVERTFKKSWNESRTAYSLGFKTGEQVVWHDIKVQAEGLAAKISAENPWAILNMESLIKDKTLLAKISNALPRGLTAALDILKNDRRVKDMVRFYETNMDVWAIKNLVMGIHSVQEIESCIANNFRQELLAGIGEIGAQIVKRMAEEDENGCDMDVAGLIVEALKEMRNTGAKTDVDAEIVKFIDSLFAIEAQATITKAGEEKISFSAYFLSGMEQAEREFISGMVIDIYRNNTKIKTVSSDKNRYTDTSIPANRGTAVASYEYKLVSRTACDENANGKKGIAEMSPSLKAGVSVDTTLNLKLKVREGYDRLFKEKITDSLNVEYGDAASNNGAAPEYEEPACENRENALRQTEDLWIQAMEKNGGMPDIRHFFMARQMAQQIFALAACEERDPMTQAIILRKSDDNLEMTSLAKLLMEKEMDSEAAITRIHEEAESESGREYSLKSLIRKISAPMAKAILQKEIGDLTYEEKQAIKNALGENAELLAGQSHLANLSVRVCDPDKKCNLYSAQSDIFGEANVPMGTLKARLPYAVTIELADIKYEAPKTFSMNITSGIPYGPGQGFASIQNVSLGAFQVCDFNEDGGIDAEDVRKFKYIVNSEEDRQYADIDGLGNFNLDDVKECLWRAGTLSALGGGEDLPLSEILKIAFGLPSEKGTTEENFTLPARPLEKPEWWNWLNASCEPAPVCREMGNRIFVGSKLYPRYTCSGNTALEYHCKDSMIQLKTSTLCPYSCENGGCVAASICQDSDEGRNNKIRGTVSLSGGETYTDRCTGWHDVTEYSCSGPFKKEEMIACDADEICDAGACRPLNKNPLRGGTEICGNGKDDDGDRLVDCFDIDCSPPDGKPSLAINYCTLREKEPVCCLYWGKKTYEFKPSFQSSDCQGAGKFHVAAAQNCTDRALAAGLCVDEGNVIVPGIGAQICCEGLTLIPPPQGAIGINGTCVKNK
ncbi:right-handed parallel beta-helix repeat-containing protein, partial [Candidatus Peregrinibacteria bacterium]|nr:right-handed parallel beta-helix repeat-containing protein [Candidatus Peregrinibacteria bacterium]